MVSPIGREGECAHTYRSDGITGMFLLSDVRFKVKATPIGAHLVGDCVGIEDGDGRLQRNRVEQWDKFLVTICH